jgi:hypothetical protein
MKQLTRSKGEEHMSFVNMAVWDRILRVVLGAALLYLGWTGTIDGNWGTFLRYFGFVPLATGLSGWCALYALFGIRTNAATPETVKAV